MYRHRHLGGADTEALDRLRGTTNECNRSEPELVFECDSSARWRGFEIDRERVLAIWRFDRSHGGTCAGKPSKAFCCKWLHTLIQEREQVIQVLYLCGGPARRILSLAHPTDFRNFLTRPVIFDRSRRYY